jgi:hypothetical protein
MRGLRIDRTRGVIMGGGGGRGALSPPERWIIEVEVTFGDFITIRTEASMKDITVARLQNTGVQTPFSSLF